MVIVTVGVVSALVGVVVPAVVTTDGGPDGVAVPSGVLAGGLPVDGPPFPDGPEAAGGLVGAAAPGRVVDDAPGVDVDVAGCTPEGGTDAGPGEVVAVVLEDTAPDGPTDGSGAGETSSLAPRPQAAAIGISDTQPSAVSSRMPSSIVLSSSPDGDERTITLSDHLTSTRVTWRTDGG